MLKKFVINAFKSSFGAFHIFTKKGSCRFASSSSSSPEVSNYYNFESAVSNLPRMLKGNDDAWVA